MNEQPIALRLAEALEAPLSAEWMKEITLDHIAAELRRLHEVNQELVEALESIVALENTEDDEWDAVERVMPHMVNLARAALAKARGTE
jgi:hypothetical protein